MPKQQKLPTRGRVEVTSWTRSAHTHQRDRIDKSLSTHMAKQQSCLAYLLEVTSWSLSAHTHDQHSSSDGKISALSANPHAQAKQLPSLPAAGFVFMSLSMADSSSNFAAWSDTAPLSMLLISERASNLQENWREKVTVQDRTGQRAWRQKRFTECLCWGAHGQCPSCRKARQLPGKLQGTALWKSSSVRTREEYA